jgi:hypothetical protein
VSFVLLDQQSDPFIHPRAGSRGKFQNSGVMTDPLEVQDGPFSIEASGGCEISFGDDRYTGRVEHGWILQRLVLAFGHRQQHHPQILAQVVIRGTDEIPNILDDQQVERVEIELCDRFGNHLGIEMANGAGGDLNHWNRGSPEFSRVIIRGEISDDHADTQASGKPGRRFAYQSGFASTWGGEDIQHEQLLFMKQRAVATGDRVVLLQE